MRGSTAVRHAGSDNCTDIHWTVAILSIGNNNLRDCNVKGTHLILAILSSSLLEWLYD